MAAREQQSWKRFGQEGEGIPAPTGPYEVGCVDLMHGDDQGQLLVRLFYPTDPGLAGRQYPYAKWIPNSRYMKAYLDFQQVKGSWWKSGLYRIMTEPRMPALYGAPLHRLQEPHPPSAESPPAPDLSSPTAEEAQPNSEIEKDKIAPPTESPDDDNTGSDAPETQTETETETTKTGTEPQTADTIQGDSQTDSQPIPQPSFPVIVFCHGLGAMRTTYSSICADLSSHGYVVASVEHTDQSACIALRRVPKPNSPAAQLCDDWVEFYFRPPDEPKYPLRNRQVLQRASEARKVLDFLNLLNDGSVSAVVSTITGEKFNWGQFRGRLQLDTAAVMGHSFGGATTIQALSEDSRFKCGIALDCWILPVDPALLETELQQPLVFINSWDFQWRKNMLAMMKLETEPNQDGISKCRIMTIRESNHKNQSDVYFVAPKSMIDGISRIDPSLAFAINQEIIITFLKRNLLNDPDFQQHLPVLDGGEGASEHVLFGTNVDLEEPRVESVDQGSGEEGPAAEIREGESVAFSKDRSSTAIAREEEGEEQVGEAAQPQTLVQEEVAVEVHVHIKDEEQATPKQDGERQAPMEEEEEKQSTAEGKEEEELQVEPTADEERDTKEVEEEKELKIEELKKEQVEENQPTMEESREEQVEEMQSATEADLKEQEPATED